MDTSTAVSVVVALFALVVVGGFLVFRSRSRVDIKTPFGSLNVEQSNEPPATQPGVVVEDAISRGGGVLAEDRTGKGAAVRRVEAQGDVLASSERPEDRPDPKA